jgi:hypothetical protein
MKASMQQGRDSFQSSMNQLNRSLNDTDANLKKAQQARKEYEQQQNAGKKGGSLALPIILAIVGMVIMQNAAGLVIGFIIGLIINASSKKE